MADIALIVAEEYEKNRSLGKGVSDSCMMKAARLAKTMGREHVTFVLKLKKAGISMEMAMVESYFSP